MKRAVYLVMVLSLVFYTGCFDKKTSKTTANKVVVTPDARTINIGEELTLKATAYDDKNAVSSDGISWKSNNTGVATVVEGKVKGIALGEATITAEKDGKTGSAVIKVLNNSTKYPKLQVPSPEWQDQIIYFVLTDRFNDGNPGNNNQGAGEYNQSQGDYYSGGDLAGVTQKIDYIKDLGATTVWITPPVANLWWDPMINFSGYHGYWARDFKAVDEHCGTLDDYKNLSNSLHEKGMYLVQDVVVNHTGNFFEYDSAWNKDNPTTGYIANKNAKPGSKPTQAPFNQNNPALEADRTAGIYHWTPELNNYNDSNQETNYQLQKLDDLNTSNPLVRAALKDSYGYWIKEVGVDAFRVDTVKFVEHDFYNDWFYGDKGIMDTAKAAGKNNFFAFGEIFEASNAYSDTGDKKVTSYLGTESKPELPAVLQFPLRETLDSVFAGGKPTGELAYRLNLFMNKSYYKNPYTTPTFIDNHDMARLRTKTDAAGLKQAVALIMTIPGIPVIYQGTEQEFVETRSSMFKNGYGSGGKDNFNNASDMYKFIKKLAEIRKGYKVFTRGSLEMLADNKETSGILAYKRVYENKTAIVIFNSSTSPVLMTNLPTGLTAGKKLKLLSGENYVGDITVGKDGMINENIPARAILILEESSEQGEILSDVSILFTNSLEGKTITGNTKVTGTISKQVPELLLVVDGKMEKAAAASVNLSGNWEANIDTSGFAPGTSDHTIVMFATGEKVVSQKVTFKANITFESGKVTIDDAVGDDKGINGLYKYPTDPSFTSQMDIVKMEAESQGSKLTMKLNMSDVTDSWKPANGFDHVSFNIYFDLPNISGMKVLPKISGSVPEGFEWNYGHFVFGWNNAVYTTVGADADKWGDPASVSPVITVDTVGKSLTFTYNSQDFKLQNWDGVKVYVTTWDFDGVDNIYRPLLEKEEAYRFGGRTNATDPMIMDELSVFELKGTTDPNEAVVISGENTVKVGKNIKLTANVAVTWATSNEAVATVDSEGNVTGAGTGSVTISAISAGGKSADKKITVLDEPETNSFYLVGTIISNKDKQWSAGDEFNLMTDKGNGVYEKSIEITTTGALEFQFATSDWSLKYTGEANIETGVEGNLIPASMANAAVNITTTGKYLLKIDTNTMKYTITKEYPVLYLVGTIISDKDKQWSAGDEYNLMTDKGNGVYEKSIEITTTGALAFQFTTSDWSLKYTGDANIETGVEGNLIPAGMANATVNIMTTGKYILQMDTNTMKYSITKEYPVLYLVGTIISNKDKQWSAGDESNLMNDKGNGVYEKSIDITTTGALAFQFTTSDWSLKYTGDANIETGVEGNLIPAGMANATVNIMTTGKYILKIDTNTMKYSITKEYPVLYLVGTIISNKDKQWSAGDESNLMINKGNGVYEKSIEITTTGALAFQFTTSDWSLKYTGDANIETGVEGNLIPAGMANATVNIMATGIYKIRIDIESHKYTVTSI